MKSSASKVRIALALTGATAMTMVPAAAQGNSTGGISASSAVANLGTSGRQATVESGPDSAATRVAAPCVAGPGRMAVTVLPLTEEGSYPIEITARGVREGSRWQIRVAWEETAQLQKFRRTEKDGTWSITTEMPNSAGDEPDFLVQASGGNHRFLCYTGAVPGPPVAFGYAACGNGLHGLSVGRRRDGAFSVGTFVLGVAPAKTRWHIQLRMRGDNAGQTVDFDDYSNRYAELVNEVTFSDSPTDPRFVLLATSRATGTRCRLRMNPADLTAPVEGGSMKITESFRTRLD